MNSTLTGLGTLGYISSIDVTSTVTGLGSSGYLSSYSTTVFQSNLNSTLTGLGTLGYISTLSLQSTTFALINAISTVAASPGLSTLSTVVSEGFSTLSTNFGVQLSSILSSYTTFARLGNVLTVDQVNGNDATATPSGLPYKTVDAAISNLITGDTVWILPGTYTFTTPITMPSNTSLRGMSLQTVKIIMSNVTTNTTMLTMGPSCRVEDIQLYLHSQDHYTLTGIEFPGTTNMTSKLRTSVVTVDNSNATTGGNSDSTAILASGTGNLGEQSFSFNCLKGSTVNLFSNGNGKKRGILVTGNNCVVSTRDLNVYVATPRDTTSIGSYVGIETFHPTSEIQLRATTVSGPLQIGSFKSSDILQTGGQINIGPGTDIVNKTAGTSSFGTYVYPTTILYGVKGNLIIAGLRTSYLWPGSLSAQVQSGNQPGYPDNTIAYYRIQQRALMNGMTSYLQLAPGQSNSTIVEVVKNGIDTGFKMGYGGNQSGVLTKSTLSVDLALGDLLSVRLSLSTPTTNNSHDLQIQLDIF